MTLLQKHTKEVIKTYKNQSNVFSVVIQSFLFVLEIQAYTTTC